MARPSSVGGDPVGRRDLLAGAATTLSQPIAGCYDAVVDDPGTDWQMPRNDLANTGATHGNAPSVDPGVRWRYRTDAPVLETPVVAGGTAYVATDRGRLHALDSGSGSVEWDVAFEAVGAPAVVDGTVYVGVRADGDARLAALDAESGSTEWEFLGGGDRYRPATVVDDWLFVESPPLGLLALEVSTGEERWRAELPGAFPGTPALAEGTLYLCRTTSGADGEPQSTVHALEARTGEERWAVDRQAEIRHSPAVADGTVYVDRFALEAPTGAEVWEASDSVGGSAPAVAGGTVLVGGDHDLHALEADTGEPLWTRPGLGSAGTSPILAAGTVYATGSAGSLHAISADTGEERWRVDVVDDSGSETSTAAGASPAVADGAIYVGGSDGTVHAIE